MRTSLLLLALAVANRATAALSFISKNMYSNNNRAESLSEYLDHLTPAAKYVLVNKLAGPSIGADVKLPTSLLDMPNTDTILTAWRSHHRSPRAGRTKLSYLLGPRCRPCLSRLVHGARLVAY